MTKVQEKIWNELTTNGSYTPRWKPGHEAQSLEVATSICEALCRELGGKKKVIRCCGLRVNNWLVCGKTLASSTLTTSTSSPLLRNLASLKLPTISFAAGKEG